MQLPSTHLSLTSEHHVDNADREVNLFGPKPETLHLLMQLARCVRPAKRERLSLASMS